MRAAALCLVVAAAGTCNQSGAPVGPAPAPSPTQTAQPAAQGAFLGVPQDAMACQLVEREGGSLALLCDVRARFAPYAQGALAGLSCLPPVGLAAEPAQTVACIVQEPYAGLLRAAIDRGP